MPVNIDIKKKWNGDIVKVQGKSCMQKSIYEIGIIIEGQAKQLAARNYGYMAASINTQSLGMDHGFEDPSKYAKETPPESHNVSTFRKITKPLDDNTVFVGTAVDYAPYQEFGTVKMVAQPFLRPSLDLAQGKTLTIVRLNAKTYFGNYLSGRDIFLEMNK
jgi:phage gpG-like protein